MVSDGVSLECEREGAASPLVMNSLPRIVISSEVEKSSLHTGQAKDVGER